MSGPETAWLNGRLVSGADARIPVEDDSFLSGVGLFETIAVRDGYPCLLERHLERMQNGARLLNVTVPESGVVERAIGDLLHCCGLREARIRLTISPVSTLITVAEMPARASMARIILCPWRRNPDAPLAGLKTTSSGENVVAFQWARARGCDEAVFLNSHGFVCEGSRTNLLLIQGGTVVTPPLASGCLPGVMRGLVLDLCRGEGIPAVEKNITPEELNHADEILLTSSIRGVQPAYLSGSAAAPGPRGKALPALVSAFFATACRRERRGQSRC